MTNPKPPEKLTVRVCRCGRVWAGGNAKYCPAGHAYAFTEHIYIPAAALDEKLRRKAPSTR